MAINQFSLKLLKRIQEAQYTDLHSLAASLGKTPGTIRREIPLINEQLADDLQIQIKNGQVTTALSYKAYLDYLASLTLDDYSLNQDERLGIILVRNLFDGFINLTKQYEGWGYSPTARKNDTAALRTLLEKEDLALRLLPRKGMEIGGDEFRLRILVLKKLLPLVDLDHDYGLRPRYANSPAEKQIVAPLLAAYEAGKSHFAALSNGFLTATTHGLTYSSKKCFVLYTIICDRRWTMGKKVSLVQPPIEITDYYFYPDPQENAAFNTLLAMLDFNPPLAIPTDEGLVRESRDFVDRIQASLGLSFITREQVEEELYSTFYKQVTGLHYDFYFVDKMVRGTASQLGKIYTAVCAALPPLEEAYGLSFQEEQRATLTIILEKWRLRNRTYGQNRKTIVIVTNTSFERVNFFVEALKEHIVFELLEILDLNEIHKIPALAPDFAICFSDRILQSIESQGQAAIKLNFYLKQEDITKLYQMGFSTSKRHFIAADFGADIAGQDDLAEYLRQHYADFFI